MTQHFTRNTVSAEKFCNKCERRTQHAVFDRRIAHCLECERKLNELHEARKAESKPEEQGNLFGGATECQ